jgi:hypothetical protein
MVGRLALVLISSLAVAADSLGVGEKAPDAAFSVRGLVTMIAAQEGGETVVAIDRDDDVQGADGIVDFAFRLQHARDLRFAFDGKAAVSVQAHRLTLAATPTIGWVFTIASRETEFPPSPSPYTAVPIQGLSRHWGPELQQSAADVAEALLASGCTAANGGLCSACETGGRGVQACTLAGEGTCWADCTEGFFACCNPGSCRCCDSREGGRPSAARPNGAR